MEKHDEHGAEKKIGETIDDIPAGICEFRKHGAEIFCVSANEQCADMFGMTARGMVGKGIGIFAEHVHPDDAAGYLSAAAALLETDDRTSGTYRIRGAGTDGYRWLHIEGKSAAMPDGDRRAYVAHTDVNELVMTEQALGKSQQALDQSQQALRSILKYVPGGVFVYSAGEDDRFAFVSENMLCMLGYTRGQFDEKFGGRFSAMIYEEDRVRVLAEINEQIKLRMFDSCSYRIEKKDGTLLWVYDEGHLVTDADGKKWFYVVVVDITSTVRDRDELESKNSEMRQLIDSIPASIIVYGSRDGELSIEAVNGYLCRTAGKSENEMLAMTHEQIAGAVFPDDYESASEFFRAMLGGKLTSAEITYRAAFAKSGDYRWYHCSAVRMPDRNGSPLIYAVYTDATYQKVQEEDFNRIIQELLVTNPKSLCAFRLNLTRNLCSDEHGASEYIRQLLDAETADGLIEKIASIITDRDEAAEFVGKYSRERLLESYAAGRDRLSTTYRRMTDSGELHWVTTYFHILKNPFTGDVEAIAYSVDSDSERRQEEIIDAITGEEYDYIGLIDACTGQIEFKYYSDKNIMAREKLPVDYGACIAELGSCMTGAGERKQYLDGVNLGTVTANLEKMPEYTFSYFYAARDGGRHRKQTRYRYLEKDRRDIMFSRIDVTAAFLHEEEYAERLKKALLDAERANEMKSDFLGNVSHDVRTPLNAILGYDGLAMQTDDPAVIRDYLEKIKTAGNTLLSLINDTLDLQKIENGSTELRLSPMRCDEILTGVAASVRPMMERKNIDFIIDSSRASQAVINVDIVRVREVLINLLSNSAKFTPEGGRVELVIECAELGASFVKDRIIVRDSGIGMSREFQEKMFEPFSQERSDGTSRADGSGLGLAIVKRLVELMGGTIDVKSAPGSGTEFVICLDFERLPDGTEPAEKQTEPAGDIRGLNILLCEDNEMNAEIARRILSMNGAFVTAVPNGRDGAERFEASADGEFDIILMDIRMPIMDGYAATRRIRECRHPRAKTIPILAMSADAYASDVEKTLECGMNGHIAKPIDPKKMLAEIARLAGRK
jgi:PAS domain S-box-containing protein